MDGRLQKPLLDYLTEKMACREPEELLQLDLQHMEQFAQILWKLPEGTAPLTEWIDLLHFLMNVPQCADCAFAVRTHVAALMGH